MILKDGEVQVNEKERKDEFDKVFKDVAAIIVDKYFKL
jgi:ribosome maturation protein Sdo1